VITIDDIRSAADRLGGIAVRTPLFESPALNEAAGGRVLLKPENLQVTGSFKIRGAYNLMSRLSPAEKASGVVAWSSGNHAQGVAAAAGMLGIHAAIVMPEDAPSAKIDNTRRLGGETILYDRYTGDREAIARAVATERKAALVPSYDHVHIIAGQGTVGLEIMEQAGDLDARPEQVLVCCGGGGLIAGCAVAIKSMDNRVAVHSVEPAGFDDTLRSLKSGRVEHNDPSARSICDALQAMSPGKLTFEINRQLLSEGLVVSDDEVRSAMRFAFSNLKMVIEPGGAVALAAVLSGKIVTEGRTTAVVLSGGNVDLGLYAEMMSESD